MRPGGGRFSQVSDPDDLLEQKLECRVAAGEEYLVVAVQFNDELDARGRSHRWNSLSAMQWLDDALATLGLIAFIASAFFAAGALCSLVGH